MLSTIANILQIVTLFPSVAATIIWGKQIFNKHNVGVILLAFAFSCAAIASILSLADNFGLLNWFKVEKIYGRTFQNEEVILDNRAFFNCTFRNVKFLYGGGYVVMEHPIITGLIGIKTTDAKASGVVSLFEGLHLLRPEIEKSIEPTP